MKRNLKNLIFLTAALLVLISAYFVAQTYAKYISTAGGNVNAEIAKWHIKVNNTHITSGSDLTNTLTPVFPGTNHIKEGIIAPGAEGYFDLELDFEEVDVSFEYEINIQVSEDSAVKDLIVKGYSFDDGANIISYPLTQKIEEYIFLSDTIEGRNIRVYIEWDDFDLTETMGNEEDTLTTTNPNFRGILDVSVAFTQILE